MVHPVFESFLIHFSPNKSTHFRDDLIIFPKREDCHQTTSSWGSRTSIRSFWRIES